MRERSVVCLALRENELVPALFRFLSVRLWFECSFACMVEMLINN